MFSQKKILQKQVGELIEDKIKLGKRIDELRKSIINGSRYIYFENKHELGNYGNDSFLWEPRELSDEERTAVAMIVNSPQYDDFRSFLLRYAGGFYHKAREFRDSRTHTLNELAKEMESMVGTLDTYKHKEEPKEPDDPFNP